MAQFLKTSELDFDELKRGLKDFLKSQRAFEDYNFEGSNFAALLDILVYNTHINGQYLNMVGSEMFLDTAQVRESVVSMAKELNYLPRSRASSRVNLIITVVPNDSPDYVTVPKNYKVHTTIGGTTYTFVVPESVVIQNDGGSFVSGEITFYEGEIVTETFTAHPTYDESGNIMPYRHFMSSENIDTSSIEVTVQNSSVDTTSYKFEYAESLFGVSSTSRVFFVEGYRDNRYQVVFGNGVLGKALQEGNIVTVTYRDTVGSAADGATSFTKGSSIDGYTSVSVASTGASFGGSERESIPSIKYNAPRHFQTQERAVIAADYINLVKTKFPEIQSVVAYGGEEEEIPQYGKVIVSVKPFGTIGNVPNSLKTQIKEYLRLKSLTTEPIIKDPDFFYVAVNSIVYYDNSLTTKTASTLRSEIITAIRAYDTTNLTEFNKDVRYSKLVKAIDDVDISIVSNDTSLRISKRWSPLTNTEDAQVIEFSFGQPLTKSTEVPSVTSSYFSAPDSEGVVQTTCWFQDDGLGAVKLMTKRDGEDLVMFTNVGTVNYTTGAVRLSSLFSTYTGNHIKVYGTTLNRDVLASANRFLIIDTSDVAVTVTGYLD